MLGFPFYFSNTISVANGDKRQKTVVVLNDGSIRVHRQYNTVMATIKWLEKTRWSSTAPKKQTPNLMFEWPPLP